MDECSLEEFISGLAEHGFKLSSRGHNTYRSLQVPDRRFVIRQRVVRLERKDLERRSRRWRLDSSYSISSQLHLARNALDHLGSRGTTVHKRKGLVATFWLIGSIAAGLALSGWALRNLLLFVTAAEPALRPKGGLILILSALAAAGLMLAAGLTWWNDRQQFRRATTVSTAKVLGRRLQSNADDEPPYHPSYQYYLHIGFAAAGMDDSGEGIELEARVKESIFRKHLAGSTMMVQYAAADPRIAILEGE